LLKEDDPKAVMQRLMDERYPIYAEADITVETSAGPHNSAVSLIITALRRHLSVRA
jgi:shikimate kinase